MILLENYDQVSQSLLFLTNFVKSSTSRQRNRVFWWIFKLFIWSVFRNNKKADKIFQIKTKALLVIKKLKYLYIYCKKSNTYKLYQSFEVCAEITNSINMLINSAVWTCCSYSSLMLRRGMTYLSRNSLLVVCFFCILFIYQ